MARAPKINFKGLDLGDLELEDESDSGKDKDTTQQERVREQVLANLAALGKISVGEDGLVFEGDKFILPTQYQGNLKGARSFLESWERDREQHYGYSRVYRFRPWDGAAAFQRALKMMFNHTGVGKARHSFFGTTPPQFVSIEIGPGRTMQVPWGDVKVDQLDAQFELGSTGDDDYGMLFYLHVEAPKKYRQHIEAFFDLVQTELERRSIYRGKAINGAEQPGFVDLSLVDPNKVVYSQDVLTQTSANLWTLVEKPDLMRELGIPLKRAVLFDGPFGSGKTLMGILTAQKAVKSGFTFILCRPGKDDLFEVLRTAQVYAPAMVWFEDIDTIAAGGDGKHVAKLLDYLDGISNKGHEVMAGFTTNHVDKIIRGVLRPGRIDAVIHIGALDSAGIEKLVKVTVPARLLADDIDYSRVAVAFDGFVPAFYREAIDRAVRYMIARTGGAEEQITTDDLVNAAEGLRPQHDMMHGATVNRAPDKLSTVLRNEVQEALTSGLAVDAGGGGHLPLIHVNGR